MPKNLQKRLRLTKKSGRINVESLEPSKIPGMMQTVYVLSSTPSSGETKTGVSVLSSSVNHNPLSIPAKLKSEGLPESGNVKVRVRGSLATENSATTAKRHSMLELDVPVHLFSFG